LVLTRFALERLLFRLSQSPHAGRFVLKGAMLMMSWFDDPHRSTRDLDLLDFGTPEPDPMLKTFREILAEHADDGVTFDADTLRVDRIRERLEYGGLRLRVVASISGARIALTIDRVWRCARAWGGGARLSVYARFSDAPAPNLCAGDGRCREVPGDGHAGACKQPDEGLLRYLDSQQVIRFQ
jgi:hypothetical protein